MKTGCVYKLLLSIQEQSKTVYIPLDTGAELVEQLRPGWRSKTLFRKLGQYGVPVYPDHLQRLDSAGIVQQLDEDIWVLTDLRCYDNKTGLSMDVESGKAWII